MTPFDTWQSGLSLQQAFVRWGEGDRWAERHNAVLAELDRLRTDPRSPLHDKPATLVRLQALGEAWDRSLAQLADLRTAFCGRIRRGHFAAIGFHRLAGGADRLEAVPSDCWTDADAVDWEGSAVTSPRGEFVDIRVLLGPPPPLTAEDGGLGLLRARPK
jgi:hypothetical protein